VAKRGGRSAVEEGAGAGGAEDVGVDHSGRDSLWGQAAAEWRGCRSRTGGWRGWDETCGVTSLAVSALRLAWRTARWSKSRGHGGDRSRLFGRRGSGARWVLAIAAATRRERRDIHPQGIWQGDAAGAFEQVDAMDLADYGQVSAQRPAASVQKATDQGRDALQPRAHGLDVSAA
jgi:hypothetical protein